MGLHPDPRRPAQPRPRGRPDHYQFVRSIREECLSRVIPLGERHLRWVVGEYVKHFHLERNHQGLGNELIEPVVVPGHGRVACRQRLGGLLRYYYRRAA